MKKKLTAIVILNWNGKILLEQFLPILLKYTPMEKTDIIIADNGSTDNSVIFVRENYPSIKVIAMDQNYGFAGGYNRALTGLNYKYVVLLNSDVEVTPNWFCIAIDYLETHPEIDALQPKILSYNDRISFEYAGAAGGFIDRYGYPFCRGRILNTLEMDNGQYDDPIHIFWGSGACLFIRLHAFWDAGGLDAQFFAHQEEIDLCWRMNSRGQIIVCLPQSYVYHIGGATLNNGQSQKIYLNFRNNLLMLYKNLPPPYYVKVMFVRFFLDYLLAIHYLLKGQWMNALAIGKARRDFQKLKKTYRLVRRENTKFCRIPLPDTIWPTSIIIEYYFRNRKIFFNTKTKTK